MCLISAVGYGYSYFCCDSCSCFLVCAFNIVPALVFDDAAVVAIVVAIVVAVVAYPS